MPGILDLLDFLGLTDDWGIFQGGSKVIECDSFLAVDFRDNARLATFPLEDGAFASYNKVETPFDIRVTMTRGGSNANRNDFIISLFDLKKRLDLFDIVTPEVTYIGANLENYTYRRTSRSGKSLITAELYFKEIRVLGSTKRYQASQASGAGVSFGGMVDGLFDFGPINLNGFIKDNIPGIPDIPGISTVTNLANLGGVL